MSDWYWKVIILKSAFVLSCLVCYLRADDEVQKLPFCNPTNLNDAPVYNDLMIVSTLDGKLTAFSTQNGVKVWDIETQPLLSSNLHHVELTAGGKWVRLIPSLSGSLYSVSGETIEPLPFNAEQLLSSSYKYSEDLVIAGSRDTSWVGVDAGTGDVVYSCGARGCGERAARDRPRPHHDMLVLRTHAHTVRALDPRAGTQRWNFSVAEHTLALSRGECGGGAGGPPAAVRFAVALHDGRLALRSPDGEQHLWQQKLDAPVANLWRLAGGALTHMDVLWEAAHTISDGITVQPSLYVGVHDKQLYVQEGPLYSRKLETAVSAAPLPWKLVTARRAEDTALSVQEDHSLSKITLYGPSGLVGDYGFFLYLQETCDQSVQVTEDAIDNEPTNNSDQLEHHHIHVHVYSLWFWWKEVLLIAISSALVMNLMIWPRFFGPKLQPISPLPSNQEVIVVERHYSRPPSASEYSSRYETDFTPLRRLGRGGFGVVFEARNNIDHCSYAVKRIVLPVKESKRERMLREVRALAKLEHEHIVRYFNAWVEEPPQGWQLSRDTLPGRDTDDVSVIMSDELTATSPPLPLQKPSKGSVMLNLHKPIDDCIDALEFDKLQEPSKRLRSLSCNESVSIIFDHDSQSPSKHTINSSDVTTPNTLSKNVATDDDSFIVFGNPDEITGLSVNHTNGRKSSGLFDLTGNLKSNDKTGNLRSNDQTGNLGQNPDFTGSQNKVTGSQISSGYSEAKKNSIDKRLERVKECDDYKTESTTNKKKKKGHTRHWSLDAVVRPASRRLFLYIQMQLCRPDSLHDWLRHNRTSEQRGDQAVKLFKQIVSAVEYVHLAGLIHRDLKPSNILFALDGRVKVGDFGLVTAMGDTSQDGQHPHQDPYQRHTNKVGTHLYMSPEQQRGRAYSYKVDIYSLGVILFELLQPFATEAERVTCLMRLRNHIYPPHFHQHYPEETAVLKLMLSECPAARPTASGVRARAPLYDHTDEQYHFTLPPADTTPNTA